jgi:hypothetical protein
MHFIVPVEKDLEFSQKLFQMISSNISELADENLKLPKQILFSGPLGKELLVYIKEKDWRFDGFELKEVKGINQIIFKYDSPLTQVEDNRPFSSNLNGQQINGFADSGVLQKMLSSYASSSFKIERTVRPEKRIPLKR